MKVFNTIKFVATGTITAMGIIALMIINLHKVANGGVVSTIKSAVKS